MANDTQTPGAYPGQGAGVALGVRAHDEATSPAAGSDMLLLIKTVLSNKDELLEIVRSRAPKKRDWWDKLSCISPLATIFSGLMIAAAGTYFTYTTNQQQQKLVALQTFEKFIPYLKDPSDEGKKLALLVIRSIGDPRMAMRLALEVSQGGDPGAEKIARDLMKGLLAEARTKNDGTTVRRAQAGLTSLIVDAGERRLREIYDGYFAVLAESRLSLNDQVTALARFDAVWSEVTKNCGDPELGEPGRSCISERERGGKFDWFKAYRDPIFNAPPK